MKLSIANKSQIKTDIAGYCFVSLVVIGVVVFTFIPAIQSLVYSFFNYDGFLKMEFAGFDNFLYMFQQDYEIGKVFANTFIYAAITVPLGLLLGYALALLANSKVPGISAFRVLFYLPVIIPAVAAGVLWKDIFSPAYGIFNQIIGVFGLHSMFFESAKSALPTLILTTVWSTGGSMVVWLASFKNIPQGLYEAARLDGASRFKQLLFITIPMSTPMIFYNLVTGIIGSLQCFNTFIIASGSGGTGPDNSLYFIAVKIYNEAFTRIGMMGYACALGWVLFIVTFALTMFVFKTGGWVQYAEDM